MCIETKFSLCYGCAKYIYLRAKQLASHHIMIPIPIIIAGFRALSAYSPLTFARSNKAKAGAEITIPFIAPVRPISFPYKGIVGMTAPTPMNKIN